MLPATRSRPPAISRKNCNAGTRRGYLGCRPVKRSGATCICGIQTRSRESLPDPPRSCVQMSRCRSVPRHSLKPDGRADTDERVPCAEFASHLRLPSYFGVPQPFAQLAKVACLHLSATSQRLDASDQLLSLGRLFRPGSEDSLWAETSQKPVSG